MGEVNTLSSRNEKPPSSVKLLIWKGEFIQYVELGLSFVVAWVRFSSLLALNIWSVCSRLPRQQGLGSEQR